MNLGSPEWAPALAQLVTQERPVLVVVDTLVRSSVGVDENSTKEMGQLIDAADRLRTAAACTVLIVHHSGKDITKGGRGNTAVLGAVDMSYQVTKTAGIVTVLKEDAKDQEDGSTLRFAMNVVETDVVGRDGKPRSTCVVGPTPAGAPMADEKNWPTCLMERISRHVEIHPNESLRRILDAVAGRDSAKRTAVDILIQEGHLTFETGKRGARLHRSVKPFRERPDDF